MKEEQFSLDRIWIDDIEAIKFVYLCQIKENEKDKSTCMPVTNQTSEYNEKNFQLFLQNFKDILRTNSVYYILKESNSFVGFLQLRGYNPRNKSAEIGFYFPKENRRKGYGKILIRLFLKTVFSKDFFWEINKIYGETCEKNIGSIKLFESFGFKLDGKMREHYWFGNNKYHQFIFSILKKDYLA